MINTIISTQAQSTAGEEAATTEQNTVAADYDVRAALFSKVRHEVEDLHELLLRHVVKMNSSYQVNLQIWNQQASPVWRKYTQAELVRSLQGQGYEPAAITCALTRLQDDSAAKVVSACYCRQSLPLHPAGYQKIGERGWFLEDDSSPIVPMEGEDPAPAIKACCRMLGLDAPIFLGWLRGCLESQLAYAAQVRGEECEYRQRASQTLCIVGAPNTGKSQVLVKLLVEGVLGHSASIPAAWLNERARFSDFMLDSSVWVADDVSSFKCQAERKRAANLLKGAGYGAHVSVEAKNKATFDVHYPSSRIILCNDDELSLQRSLVDYNETPDKVLVLHNCSDAGFLADYGGDLDLMDETIRKAIPAFAHWLLHTYKLPEWTTATGKASARHMVMDAGYVSPYIAAILGEIDEAGELMQLLSRVYASRKELAGKWVSQSELLVAISGEAPKGFNPTSNMFGRTLAKCCQRWGGLLKYKKTNTGAKYCLVENQAWGDALTAAMPKRVTQIDGELLQAAGLDQDTEYRKTLEGYIDWIDSRQQAQ